MILLHPFEGGCRGDIGGLDPGRQIRIMENQTDKNLEDELDSGKW